MICAAFILGMFGMVGAIWYLTSDHGRSIKKIISDTVSTAIPRGKSA